MAMQGMRKRRRPKKRWFDTVRKICRFGVSVSGDDVEDRITRHMLIELGTLQDGRPSQNTADKVRKVRISHIDKLMPVTKLNWSAYFPYLRQNVGNFEYQ